jgi:DNA-binding transcriptional MerR regulator
MAQQLLTVSEVVDCCAPPSDELRTTWLRRLRDWSNIGLLHISGRYREGAGRHRLYSPDAVYVAAVMLRLADLGVPVGTLIPVAEIIQRPSRARRKQDFRNFWAEAKQLGAASDEAFLAIRPEPRSDGTFYEFGWGAVAAINSGDAWAIISLTAVFSRLEMP